MSNTYRPHRKRRFGFIRRIGPHLRALAAALGTSVRSLVGFLQRNGLFVETLTLGAIAALLLDGVPTVGPTLASLALAVAAGVGLLRQLKHSFASGDTPK
jgi:hypothetical protein